MGYNQDYARRIVCFLSAKELGISLLSYLQDTRHSSRTRPGNPCGHRPDSDTSGGPNGEHGLCDILQGQALARAQRIRARAQPGWPDAWSPNGPSSSPCDANAAGDDAAYAGGHDGPWPPGVPSSGRPLPRPLPDGWPYDARTGMDGTAIILLYLLIWFFLLSDSRWQQDPLSTAALQLGNYYPDGISH